MIPYGRQDISQADIDSVINTLKSDFLTQGPQVPLFEKAISDYCNVKYGVACNSATSALHIACLALNLSKGDWMWTSPNSFVASANCGLYCGAKVDFIDIDPKTYNLSIDALKFKLEVADKEGKIPKILVAVHYAGQPCEMMEIQELGKKYGFFIIEDASHALGAMYKDTKIGSCAYSDITILSFHPVKISTTGEGGIALTNNINLAKRLHRLRTHGITAEKKDMELRPKEEIWNYQQVDLGFNYRMTDIEAVLGINQMKRLDQFIARRSELANRYFQNLAKLPIIKPFQSTHSKSSFHLFPIRIQNIPETPSQLKIFNGLKENGISANLHYIPVYRQPYYEKMGFKEGYCPEAEKFHKECISLPLFPKLTNDEQDYIVQTLKKLLL